MHLLREKPDKRLQEIVMTGNPTAVVPMGRSRLHPSVLFFHHVNIATHLPAVMRLAVYSAYCSC